MQKQPVRKGILLVLITCLILGVLPGSWAVNAEPAQELTNDMENAETPAPLDADTVSEIIGYEEANLPTQTNSAFFKYVDETTFQSNNHISRILEEETLSTYVFRNSDGTKTVYYLPDNVKFIAEDGKVKEKDLTLVAKTGGYGVKRSDISYLLPTSASSGIRLEHGSKEVALFPQNQNAKAGKATVTGESVRYANYLATASTWSIRLCHRA